MGGTISKVTGGKFANGARYAAFAAIASSIGQHIKAGGTINNPKIRVETEANLKADAIAEMNVDVSSPEILAKAIENGAPEYVEQVNKLQHIGEINGITVTARQMGTANVLPRSTGDVITLQQYMEGALRNRESNHRRALGTISSMLGFGSGSLAVGATLAGKGLLTFRAGQVAFASGVSADALRDGGVRGGDIIGYGSTLKTSILNHGMRSVPGARQVSAFNSTVDMGVNLIIDQ